MVADLGPSVESLAAATFDLLSMQDWFDCILVIDDSSASDILSFHLSSMYERQERGKKGAVIAPPGNRSAHSVGTTRKRRLQVIQVSKNLPEKEVRSRNHVHGHALHP